MNSVDIKKDDVIKAVYFIISLTQKQGSPSMQSGLSSKGDLIGGIFDRWINIIPESIVFNNLLLPKISTEDKIEIISDFYLYDPKKAGIAPDVIGIKLKNKAIPFAVYKDKWEAVEGMPQIEVKTFKKPQKMISLRNQHYDNKYLVMTESEFKIDYLMPFFDKSIFSNSVYNQLHMDDSTFIISNEKGLMHQTEEIRNDSDILGNVTLLKVTSAKSFMDCSTLCEGNVSVQYLNSIEKKSKKPNGQTLNARLKDYCEINQYGLYTFNTNWYEGVTSEGVPFYTKKSKSGNIQFLYKTLDISIENIESISILKKSNSSIYVTAYKDASINGVKLLANNIYKLEFQLLDRSSNNGQEYFMQKNLVDYIPDKEDALLNSIDEIINR